MAPKQWQRSYPSTPLHFFLHSYSSSSCKTHGLRIIIHCAHFIIFTISIILGYPSPTEAKYTLTTRLGHETHKQQGMFLRPYRKTTSHLCDGHRLYSHNQKTYAQTECNLKHATTCSTAVNIKHIPYLGKRWLSTLTWLEALNPSKADKQNQAWQSPIITIKWEAHKNPI